MATADENKSNDQTDQTNADKTKPNEPTAEELKAQLAASEAARLEAEAAAETAKGEAEEAKTRAAKAEEDLTKKVNLSKDATEAPEVKFGAAKQAPPEVSDELDNLGDDELTVGQYVDRHSITGKRKRDKNFRQMAKFLDMDVEEVVEICRELGHNLPVGQ